VDEVMKDRKRFGMSGAQDRRLLRPLAAMSAASRKISEPKIIEPDGDLLEKRVAMLQTVLKKELKKQEAVQKPSPRCSNSGYFKNFCRINPFDFLRFRSTIRPLSVADCLMDKKFSAVLSIGLEADLARTSPATSREKIRAMRLDDWAETRRPAVPVGRDRPHARNRPDLVA
jgi:hypothetical protein